MDTRQLVAFLTELFEGEPWPKPLPLLRSLLLVEEGLGEKEAADTVGVSERSLKTALQGVDPLNSVLGETEVAPADAERRKNLIGQLIVGRAAEFIFEEIYRKELGNSDFTLADHRRSRSGTDYRMLDGSQRPVYRLNVKFFGSTFRLAREHVNLDESDCFPLATYKIKAALDKQHQENLAYIFAVVGVPGLTGKLVAERFSPEEIDPLMHLLFAKKVTGKRGLEDRFVEWQATKQHLAFTVARDQIRPAAWHVLSARKADRLLKNHLYDRVIAISMPRFTRVFSNAEVDMHFSLRGDLRDLTFFFRVLREGGVQLASSMLERGDL